jgi:hypothetical protein
MHWWGMLQLAHARVQAHFFTAFKAAVFRKSDITQVPAAILALKYRCSLVEA